MNIVGSVFKSQILVQKRGQMDKKAAKDYLLRYDGNERYHMYVKK